MTAKNVWKIGDACVFVNCAYKKLLHDTIYIPAAKIESTQITFHSNEVIKWLVKTFFDLFGVAKIVALPNLLYYIFVKTYITHYLIYKLWIDFNTHRLILIRITVAR